MIKVTIPRIKHMFIDDVQTKLPKRGGVYLLYGTGHKELLYIGKAQNLRGRVKGHLTTNKQMEGIRHNFKWVDYFCVRCPVERDMYETYLINKLKPSLNVDKVYTYITNRWLDKYKSEEQKEKERMKQIECDKVYLSVNL